MAGNSRRCRVIGRFLRLLYGSSFSPRQWRTNVATGEAVSGVRRSSLNPWTESIVVAAPEGRTECGSQFKNRLRTGLAELWPSDMDRITRAKQESVATRRFVRSSGAGSWRRRSSTGSASPLRADSAAPVATIVRPCRGDSTPWPTLPASARISFSRRRKLRRPRGCRCLNPQRPRQSSTTSTA